MDIQKRISEIEQKIAVLEYRVNEHQEHLKIIKPALERMEKMLRQIMENPFGINSQLKPLLD